MTKVKDLQERIGVSRSVATELLLLAGDDVDLAEQASIDSIGLDQCKARIIDRRIKKLEVKQ